MGRTDHMTAAELVGKLRARGVRLQVIRGDLKVGARKGVLTPELTNVVSASKAAIVELLAKEGTDPASQRDTVAQAIEQAQSWADLSALCKQIDEAYHEGQLSGNEVETLTAHVTQKSSELPEPEPQQRLSSLLADKPIQRVRSAVLGEDVLWAADTAEIPKDNALVVYRESELRELVGRSPDALRAIHRCKRCLDMELVEPCAEEGERIDAETLLGHTEDDSCYACGKSNWWTKANGQRMCCVCHPKPRVKPGVSA